METFKDLREGALDSWRTRPTKRSIQELEAAEDELEDIEMNSKLESNDYTSRVSDNPMIFEKRGNTSYSADIDELLTEIK